MVDTRLVYNCVPDTIMPRLISIREVVVAILIHDTYVQRCLNRPTHRINDIKFPPQFTPDNALLCYKLILVFYRDFTKEMRLKHNKVLKPCGTMFYSISIASN